MRGGHWRRWIRCKVAPNNQCLDSCIGGHRHLLESSHLMSQRRRRRLSPRRQCPPLTSGTGRSSRRISRSMDHHQDVQDATLLSEDLQHGPRTRPSAEPGSKSLSCSRKRAKRELTEPSSAPLVRMMTPSRSLQQRLRAKEEEKCMMDHDVDSQRQLLPEEPQRQSTRQIRKDSQLGGAGGRHENVDKSDQQNHHQMIRELRTLMRQR